MASRRSVPRSRALAALFAWGLVGLGEYQLHGAREELSVAQAELDAEWDNCVTLGILRGSRADFSPAQAVAQSAFASKVGPHAMARKGVLGAERRRIYWPVLAVLASTFALAGLLRPRVDRRQSIA